MQRVNRLLGFYSTWRKGFRGNKWQLLKDMNKEFTGRAKRANPTFPQEEAFPAQSQNTHSLESGVLRNELRSDTGSEAVGCMQLGWHPGSRPGLESSNSS